MCKKFLIIVIVVLAGFSAALLVGTNEIDIARNSKILNLTGREWRELEKEEKIKRRANGYAKPDKPSEFARYHHDLRTSGGDGAAEYELNYKIKELKSAKVRLDAYRAGRKLKSAESMLNWIERGPGNVSGRTRGLIIDPDDESGNTWITGSVGGGIWRTTNAGSSWANLTPDLPNLATVCIAMAESNHNVIYAGTGEGYFNTDAIGGSGIFKSTDRGATWSQLASTANSSNYRYVNRLVIDPTNQDIVVAVTNNGIYKTIDGGTTWSRKYWWNNRVQHIITSPASFDTQYATANQLGVLKSTNGGDTWTLSHSHDDGRIELAIAPNDPSTVYALDENSKLFISTNAGTTWQQVTVTGQTDLLAGQGWYDNTLAVSPSNKLVLFVGGVNLFKLVVTIPTAGAITATSSKIADWAGQGAPYVHADSHNIQITQSAGNPFRIVVANDGGVGYSDNGGVTWTNPANGYNTTQFYGVDKHPNSDRYIGGMQDNGSWVSGIDPTSSANWIEATGGDGFDVVWNSFRPDTVISSLYNNRLFVSYNNGSNFQALTVETDDLDWGSELTPFVTKVANDPAVPDKLFMVSSSGVARSEDFGESWTTVNLPLSSWGFFRSGQVAISPANPDIVWAGCAMHGNRKLHVSTDGGYTFNATTNYRSIGSVARIVPHPKLPNSAFALFGLPNSPKILRTDDLGNSWTDLSEFTGTNTVSPRGFPNVATLSLLVMPFDTNEIWAGTEIGLFISRDNGATWLYADNGLPAVSIWDMKIRGNEVVLATHGRGVWTVELSQLNGMKRAPIILSTAQGVDGQGVITYHYPNSYDSVRVKVNGVVATTLREGQNAVYSANLNVELDDELTVNTIQMVGYIEEDSYISGSRRITTLSPLPAVRSYANNFENREKDDDFVGTGFDIRSVEIFEGTALHTAHPYAENSELIYTLRKPIIVTADDNEQALLRYEDIPMIEVGEVGSQFGSSRFYDYVIVEGTTDGVNWQKLGNGYDFTSIRSVASMYNVADENAVPVQNMFRERQYDLLQTFSAGDIILIRFRLFSDQFTAGWGWVIDNLRIQTDSYVRSAKLIASKTKVYPNPAKDIVNIAFDSSWNGKVELSLYDVAGRKQKAVEVKAYSGNRTSIDVSHLNNGIYILELMYNNSRDVRKIQIRH